MKQAFSKGLRISAHSSSFSERVFLVSDGVLDNIDDHCHGLVSESIKYAWQADQASMFNSQTFIERVILATEPLRTTRTGRKNPVLDDMTVLSLDHPRAYLQ